MAELIGLTGSIGHAIELWTFCGHAAGPALPVGVMMILLETNVLTTDEETMIPSETTVDLSGVMTTAVSNVMIEIVIVAIASKIDHTNVSVSESGTEIETEKETVILTDSVGINQCHRLPGSKLGLQAWDKSLAMPASLRRVLRALVTCH